MLSSVDKFIKACTAGKGRGLPQPAPAHEDDCAARPSAPFPFTTLRTSHSSKGVVALLFWDCPCGERPVRLLSPVLRNRFGRSSWGAYSMPGLVYRTARIRRGWLDRLKGFDRLYETRVTDGERIAYGRGPTRETSEQSARRNWEAKYQDHGRANDRDRATHSHSDLARRVAELPPRPEV
jgi:hypothetical protein